MNTLIMLSFVTLSLFTLTYGFGSMGPISAVFGQHEFFCAIDASGKQEVTCWSKNTTTTSYAPPMAALSGGYGFMCGILVETSYVACWNSLGFSRDLVPGVYQTTSYTYIASGKDHVCGIRGSYYSSTDSGSVDCWDIVQTSNGFGSKQSALFNNQVISTILFNKIVSGDGFSCGSIKGGGLKCWGPKASNLNIPNIVDHFLDLASGKSSICGVLESSGEIKCWGDSNLMHSLIRDHPIGRSFVSLASGAEHFCGIRKDDHGIECWGKVTTSSIPKGSGFLAIASSDSIMCGIREAGLFLDCWFANASLPFDFNPMLLCSPGLCRPGSCGPGKFAFNASLLHDPSLTNLCVRKGLSICSPCGFNCSNGFFPSSSCTENADRVCTTCSLCQSSSCYEVCNLKPHIPRQDHRLHRLRNLMVIMASSLFGVLLIVVFWCIFLQFFSNSR